MDKDKQNDIATELESIDLAVETIRGALLDIERSKSHIHDILNGTTGDELFKEKNKSR